MVPNFTAALLTRSADESGMIFCKNPTKVSQKKPQKVAAIYDNFSGGDEKNEE